MVAHHGPLFAPNEWSKWLDNIVDLRSVNRGYARRGAARTVHGAEEWLYGVGVSQWDTSHVSLVLFKDSLENTRTRDETLLENGKAVVARTHSASGRTRKPAQEVVILFH